MKYPAIEAMIAIRRYLDLCVVLRCRCNQIVDEVNAVDDNGDEYEGDEEYLMKEKE